MTDEEKEEQIKEIFLLVSVFSLHLAPGEMPFYCIFAIATPTIHFQRESKA